jgi:putative transposase
MARRERLKLTGFPFHIMQRGNNCQACDLAEVGYQFFLHYLGKLAKRGKSEFQAYVLITN